MNYKVRLQELRIKNGLSQLDVANYLNLARQTYNHYEVQENVIPLKYLNALANYFNVSIDYILGLTDAINYTNSKSDIYVETFAKLLKEFRKENKLTQEKLASLLNTNKSVICNYERGRNIIATPFLYDICKEYNVSADYLLGKIESPKYLD